MTTAASNEGDPTGTAHTSADGFPAWYWAYQDGVNIRTKPDVDATSVGHLQRGDQILVNKLMVEGGRYAPTCGSTIDGSQWWPVNYFGQTRYVAMPCLIRMDPQPSTE